MLYEFVQDTLKPVDGGETPWKYPVLLVDDLSVLLSLGVGAVSVLDFMQYCRAVVCCEWKVSRGCCWSSAEVSEPKLCVGLSLSVCFPLADPEILCSTLPALPYLAVLNNKPLKIKG